MVKQQPSMDTVDKSSKGKMGRGQIIGVDTVMQPGAKKCRGGGGSMSGWGVGDDEEFLGNVLEEDKSKGFDSIATKGGREEKEMPRIVRSKAETSSQLRKEVNVILMVCGEEERLSKRVKGCMGEDQRVIEVWEGRERDVMTKKEATLMADDGEFVVSGVLCRAVEIIIDAKCVGEGGSSYGIIIEMNIAGDGFSGDSEAGVRPCCVCEGRNKGGGGDGMIVEANAAFIGMNAEFVYNGHVARDSEVMLNNRVESRGGGCSDITTCVVAVGMGGECRRLDG